MGFEHMRDAVQAIGEAAGVGTLTPNADGAFELIVNKALPVYFQEMSDTDLEVSARVPWLDNKLDASMTEALLAANGSARSGRFSVEPSSNRVFFGGRVNIVSHDARTLAEAVNAIIREAAGWNITSEGTLRQNAGSTETVDVLSETLIRA